LKELESILEKTVSSDKKKVMQRRFIIVQGLYENFGDICNLKKIIELKKKYKFRLILDDSFGFGVLGKTGKGVIELFDIDVYFQIINRLLMLIFLW
jgi:7-keto-8-aminopelargonate synthetase-like enzyme